MLVGIMWRRGTRLASLVLLSVLAVLIGMVGQPSLAQTSPPACAAPAQGQPMFITEECVDPRFNDPFIETNELRATPVPHRFVTGGFRGTDARFAFYFPTAQYGGRFFLGPIHQLLRPNSEIATPEEIGFAFDSGAYLVETNNGGQESCLLAREGIEGRCDPAVRGYRVNAAASKFSRVLAAEIYGAHRPYGYIYGGSGGAFMTFASAEQTRGVWDGFVPFVLGHPHAGVDHFVIRMHALRILRQRNKFPEIVDAIEPGGSGNPYATLNAEEAAALGEATRFGIPLRAWWGHASMNGGYLGLVAASVPLLDPTYADDFWSLPGYLGHDDPSVQALRIQHPATVVATTPDVAPPSYDQLGYAYTLYMYGQYAVPLPPKGFVLSSMPAGDLTGADLVITSGGAAGKSCPLYIVKSGLPNQTVVSCAAGSDPEMFNNLDVGTQVRVDNSWYLALQTHPRHAVPTRDFLSWNQYRRGGSGSPIYPQRDVLLNSFQAAGAVSTGRFYGKMIAVSNLMDFDAFPSSGDWYRNKVQELFKGQTDNVFRLWFTDYAQHGFTNDRAPYGLSPAVGENAAHTVDFKGVLQQALRDLSAWVERGVAPPASTSYQIVDGAQVQVASTAAQRGGIQPVVDLRVNGGVRADVAVGQPVTFTAQVQVPPGAGKVVDAEWDFTGSGTFVRLSAAPIAETVTVQASFAYTQPGTYFPVLRATSQRQGNPATPYARVENLGKVRVVVGNPGPLGTPLGGP